MTVGNVVIEDVSRVVIGDVSRASWVFESHKGSRFLGAREPLS